MRHEHTLHMLWRDWMQISTLRLACCMGVVYDVNAAHNHTGSSFPISQISKTTSVLRFPPYFDTAKQGISALLFNYRAHNNFPEPHS
eukprot:1414641-Amphidinium_carterae.1